jgi:Flp pilus assembly protein TadG
VSGLRVLIARLRLRRVSRGQALVEFMAFLMFLLFLVQGVVNVGGLLDDHLSIVYATRQGARTAAVLGQQTNADCAVVGAVNAAMAGLANVKVTKITIYQANASGQSAGPADVYSTTTSGPPIICTGTTITPSPPTQSNYAPTSRNNLPFTEDSIGVRVDYVYTFQFPFFSGGTFAASDYTVMPVNPVGLPTTPTPGAPTPTPCPPTIICVVP